MFKKQHEAIDAVEEFRYKRELEEHYLTREKKSIEASRKVILLEKERLHRDFEDLSESIYQEVENDLRELSLDLRERESAFEVRKQHYEEQLWGSRSQEKTLMEQANAKRPFWKKWKERTDTFLEDAALDGDMLTLLSVALMLAVAAIAGFFTIVF